MLTLSVMLIRLAAAVLLGAIVGLERELIGKEAGIRTNIMVAAGAALFSVAGITLPYLIALSPENLSDVIAHNGGFLTLIGNVVIGVGFLGAGIIVKDGIRVRGLTTAATVWFTAAVGVLCGIGLIELAAIAVVGLALLLFILRKMRMHRLRGAADENDAE
jgi:putative Mg2+ transporter-C (MgtC) family protein